jgi:hypothetical protein
VVLPLTKGNCTFNRHGRSLAVLNSINANPQADNELAAVCRDMRLPLPLKVSNRNSAKKSCLGVKYDLSHFDQWVTVDSALNAGAPIGGAL